MKQKKFALKPTVVGLSASLSLSVILLTACGGGTSSTGSIEVVAPARNVNQLIMRAEAEIEKKVYTLSSNIGAYGEILRKDGYSFVQVSSLGEVPTSPHSVLYLASDGAGLSLGLNTSQLRSFKGVIVFDSNQVAKADATAGAASVDSVSANGQSNEGESPAAKLYRTVMGDVSTATPNTTAFMTSTVTNTILPLDVDASGRVNGFEASDFAFVAPQAYAMSAKDVADGKVPKATTINSTKSPNIPKIRELSIAANNDRTIDIIRTVDGYRLVGRAYIWATRDTGGSFLAARKYVSIVVDTGSNDTGCMVNGTPCGVYPVDQWEPIKSTSSTGLGTVTIQTVPHLYYAEARVSPAKQIMNWAPRESAWTTDSETNDDSFETTTSSGWAFGASGSISTAGSFSVGPSASYSRTVTVKKKTYFWDGYESNTLPDSDNNNEARTASGIQSINMKVRGAISTGSVLWKNNENESQRVNMFNAFVGGRYCNRLQTSSEVGDKFCASSANQSNRGDGSTRSRISYSGWNPALRTVIEIPTNFFESANSTKQVAAVVALGMDRKLLQYERITNLDLCSEDSGYRLKGTTSRNCTIENVATPSSTNSTTKQYFVSTRWNLPVAYFSNAN